MNTIWEYLLRESDEQGLDVKEPADFLSVGQQAGQLVLWALVDPSRRAVSRTVLIRGTGHPLPEPCAKLIGTVLMPNGPVWRVFDGEIRGRGVA